MCLPQSKNKQSESTVLLHVRQSLYIYALMSSHGGGEEGVTPGTYTGMGRDLLTLVANFNPGMGGLDCFCTFIAGSPGKDPQDL